MLQLMSKLQATCLTLTICMYLTKVELLLHAFSYFFRSDSMQKPFSVPTELKSQIKNFEMTYTGPPKTAVLSKPDEVTENLFL